MTDKARDEILKLAKLAGFDIKSMKEKILTKHLGESVEKQLETFYHAARLPLEQRIEAMEKGGGAVAVVKLTNYANIPARKTIICQTIDDLPENTELYTHPPVSLTKERLVEIMKDNIIGANGIYPTTGYKQTADKILAAMKGR